MNTQNEIKLKTIKLIHLAFAVGLIFLAIVIFLQASRNEISGQVEPSLTNKIQLIGIISLIILALNVFAGRAITRKIFLSAKQTPDTSNKIQLFLTGHIIRMALIEGPALLSLVGLMLFALQGGNLFQYQTTVFHYTTLVTYFALWILYFPGRDNIFKNTGIQEL